MNTGTDAQATRARIDVVAGVITDGTGRILLARRTDGRDLAGLWEFPGGKREPGESAEDALVRELHEELGIRAIIGAPVIAVAQAYPGKRLRLDVRHVPRWEGRPHGREGQALAWVPPVKLASYAMPPADRPVVAALRSPDHCLVTPPPGDDDLAWLDALDRSLDQGIRRVQLRLHDLPAARLHALVGNAVARCRAAGADVLVNAHLDLALECGAGLHLPAAQLARHRERPVPADVLLSASCHDEAELRAAQALGCDFVVTGPVRATASHPGMPGIGWARFEQLREGVSLPIYAIGGLGPADLAIARAHGAQGIAAIRAFWPSSHRPASG